MSSKLIAAFFSGIFLALPFLFPILFPLSWLAFVPLFWALKRSESLPRGFFLGWLAGWVANLSGFYWLDYTIRVFGGFPPGASEIVFVGFAAYGALPLALFALLVRLCGFGPLYLYPALFWVALEFSFPLLFPWHLANSQSGFLSLIQSADIVGPYGASFLLVWLNTVLYARIFLSERDRTYLAGALTLSALLAASLLYGHWRLKEVESQAHAAPTVKIAAVQGDIDIHRKWNMTFLASNLNSYRALTATVDDARLVIWPETAVEAWVPESIVELPAEILPSLPRDAAFIFGARSFRGNPARPDVKAFNSAFLTDGRGRVSGFYHKQALLAFGEYLPFAALLSKLPGVPPIGDGFTSGDGPRTLDLPDGLKAAPLICYEDLMPGLARRFVADKGANLLVNLTNDAWFGNTAAPWQHARLAQWRAIETRRYLVRVTNTGLTSVIDPRGEMRSTLPLFSSGVLTVNVALLEGETLYVRFGDWFAWMLTGASLIILLACNALRLLKEWAVWNRTG
jgi:apolipoprotein N-acyltransferase